MPVNATNNNLGMVASPFSLLNVDDNFVSLDKAKGKNGTVIRVL